MCPCAEVRAAGFVIYRIVEEIQFLLLQTSYSQHHWTPPKGHVDAGENDLETAYRETEEEAGLTSYDITVKDFKREIQYPVRNKTKVAVYWLAELNRNAKDVKLSDEHQDYKWLPLKEAQRLAKFEQMGNLLAECEQFIKSKM